MIILLIWYLLQKVLEAANGKVTFLNNSGRSVKITTYNENDILHWVPYQTLIVAPDDVARLQASGENFINVYVDSVIIKPRLGKSYVYNGIDLIKQS